ncbi:hypothetical protein [Nannocystis radixulma]|uniref:Uncharacterized protein n=1 Tax=Nannocystis radixulma TaxID=2995305 RepID=A0ABT5B7U9_9BACT|nr:hypothetical protein [Nannocystis radixulma]MDC0669813.1 hypothetical protein [Nannocystis radixulma]
MYIGWQQGDDKIRIGGRTHTLPGPAEQVLAWPGRPLIAVLLEPSAGPQRLLLLDVDGQTYARLGPPDGYDLYYLEPDSGRGVTAVCTTEPPVNGWRDWRFAISVERGELQRISPSK